MEKRERAGVQGDESLMFVFVRRSERYSRSVHFITEHRIPARRRLHANLVRAAGLQLDLQPGAGLVKSASAIVENRFLPGGMRRFDDGRFRLAVKLVQIVVPGAIQRLDDAFHGGPVDLVDAAAFELLGELAGGAASL